MSEELKCDVAIMKTDIALIKQRLLGDNDKKNGMIDKVEKHEKYFYITYGILIFLGYAVATVASLQ